MFAFFGGGSWSALAVLLGPGLVSLAHLVPLPLCGTEWIRLNIRWSGVGVHAGCSGSLSLSSGWFRVSSTCGSAGSLPLDWISQECFWSGPGV